MMRAYQPGNDDLATASADSSTRFFTLQVEDLVVSAKSCNTLMAEECHTGTLASTQLALAESGRGV